MNAVLMQQWRSIAVKRQVYRSVYVGSGGLTDHPPDVAGGLMQTERGRRADR